MTVHPSATSVATLSAAQRELLHAILEGAYEVDSVCTARDRDLRDRVGLKLDDSTAGVTLTRKEVLAVEDSLYWLHRELANLHALLAPVAIDWISELPDVAAVAIIKDEHAAGVVDDGILQRLFERAGIADRFVPIRAAASLVSFRG